PPIPGAPPGPGQPGPGQPGPGQPGGREVVQIFPINLTYELKHQQRYVVALVDIDLDQKIIDAIYKDAEPYFVRIHGGIEMASAEPHPTVLGAAARDYSNEAKQFPAAAAARKAAASRAKRPWPPDQRISWLAELLPYLDKKDVHERIKNDQSWRDPENA